ncbi:hypothetical protein L2E82_32707 [Cichorium intybus]|uniref:Uncharacterized protein n=1 Tax=Cichorium intybus TaxID=13427 RepID=A0ACB9BJ35_CICIN|nr:hypothetical protein L2E82_32707 [Cichorium intybus]
MIKPDTKPLFVFVHQKFLEPQLDFDFSHKPQLCQFPSGLSISRQSLQPPRYLCFSCVVLLRDLFDDTIITIVEELQRRLPPAIFDFIGQGEDKEGTGVRLEAQTN